MDASEKALDLGFPSWNCAYGPEGAIVTRFQLDPRCVRPTNKLFYVDDVSRSIDPEFEPGAWGTFAFSWTYYLELSAPGGEASMFASPTRRSMRRSCGRISCSRSRRALVGVPCTRSSSRSSSRRIGASDTPGRATSRCSAHGSR